MRPRSLTVSALRSHGSTTVAFPDDWQLTAIVGPTGAGKSSILEAIVYGLFGSGTVPNASQPINLIADNAREMRVVLEFEVAGTIHQIVRTYRRSGASPPPVLKSPGQAVSGVRPVEEALTRLLGLSQDAFCQTALLPQGRFARLLEAGVTDQKRTLDEFFRLAEVTEVADRIAMACDQVAGVRDRVETIRQQLPAEPEAAVEVAARTLAATRTAAEVAAALEATVASLLLEADRADGGAAQQEQAAAGLDHAASALQRTAGDAQALAAIAERIASTEHAANVATEAAGADLAVATERVAALNARLITAARSAVAALDARVREASEATSAAARLECEAADVEKQLGAATVELDRAGAAHSDADRVATDAEASAGRLAAQCEAGQVLADASANAAAAAALASSAAEQCQTDLNAAGAALQAATEARDNAQLESDAASVRATKIAAGASIAADAAAATVKDAEGLEALDAARGDAEAAAEAAAATLMKATGTAERAGTDADSAEEARKAAQTAHDQAEAVLEHARATEAAAVAAAHCHSGDPCPICARELPAGFVAPEPLATLLDAENAAQASRRNLDSATQTATVAAVNADNAERDRLSASRAAGDAAARLADATEIYRQRGSDAARNTARARADAATKTARQTQEQAVAAAQYAAAASAALRARSDAIDPLEAALVRAERTLSDAAAALASAEHFRNASLLRLSSVWRRRCAANGNRAREDGPSGCRCRENARRCRQVAHERSRYLRRGPQGSRRQSAGERCRRCCPVHQCGCGSAGRCPRRSGRRPTRRW